MNVKHLLLWKQSLFWAIDQSSEFVKLCIIKIPKKESIQEKFKLWEIEIFETKATNDTVFDSFCKGIHFNESGSMYQTQLPFKDDHDLFPDNFNHFKARLKIFLLFGIY